MPAQFPNQFRTALTTFMSTTGGATTFASRLVTLLGMAFGPSNPFGTAATRDAGTAEGNVPELRPDGTLDPGVLPDASTTSPGIITIADSLADTTPGAVATPGQVAAAVAGLTGGLQASSFALSELALNTAFTTPGAGFLIGSSGGQGGDHSPAAARPGPGNVDRQNGESLTIQYGAATATGFSNSSPSLTVLGGGQHSTNASFEILSIDSAAAAANRAPRFAFMRGGDGAPGGREGLTVGTTPRGGGLPGNLVVAMFVSAGIHLMLTEDGTGGRGGSHPRATDGEAGSNGFAVYVRID